jgi:hypothetical protein
LDGVWGVDFVRTRAGEATLGDGFNGDAARERDADGTNTFGFDGERVDGDGGIRDIVLQGQRARVAWLPLFNNVVATQALI